jgi:dTDP-4-amino-4,6-dideoxygalactose transaminase
MVTTARADWDSRIRRLRQHGMTLPAHERHAARVVTTETYEELGFNYRLSDIQAAIGQVQVERLPALVAARRRLAARYTEQLRGVVGVVPPVEPAWARSNWQTYCVWLREDADQHVVMQRMIDRGVASRPAVMCAHRVPAYPDGTWRCGSRSLVHGERARDHAIQLPLFPSMTDAEQDQVVQALAEALAEADQDLEDLTDQQDPTDLRAL